MSEKKKHRVIIGIELFLLCMIIATLSINAASANPPSNGVSYNKNGQVTVENALDNLYSKANYGDAKASEILKGKKALVGGKEVVGTFTCPTLASLTPGDATPENIDKGKIAWVNGNKVIGTYGLLADKVKLGDYISYTPKRTSHLIPKAYTGWSSDQTINPSELNLWRVIRKNEDGTIDMVSENVSSNEVSFYGPFEFTKYADTLNMIAYAYETVGITVGSRNMGFDDTKEYQECYKTDMELVETAIGTLTVPKVPNSWEYSYWLSSMREDDIGLLVKVQHALDVAHRDVYVSASGNIYNYGASAYVRPIVILKPSLKITGGDGTENSPYTLGV